MTELPQHHWLRRRPILYFLHRRLVAWHVRHRAAVNFWLHMPGIPLVLYATPALLLYRQWAWAFAAFALGYLLQWVGHRVEGNDVGEWAAVKRLLGLPYVSVSPRWDVPEAAARPTHPAHPAKIP